MGFLSKLMKKAKPFLPFALPFLTGPAMGMMGKGMMGKALMGMNPMARNMLMQSVMGYGTAALSGSKRPGKAAMYAGLASLPFSYMSAANAANVYNQQFSGKVPTTEGAVGSRMVGPPGRGFTEPIMGQVPTPDFTYEKMTPWDVLSGPQKLGGDPTAAANRAAAIGQEFPSADIFSKTSPGGTGFGGVKRPPIGTKTTDWIPTMASQTAALYGGGETAREEWIRKRGQRKKELAWMYGVPEEMIEGEMTNPWSNPHGGFWNKGGIASLENGGDVSGPGTGTSDSINANLSDGEFVMTAKAVENLGNGDRYEGARQMYDLMNVLDPESENMSEVI